MQGVCEDVKGARGRGAACLLEGLGDNIQAVRCTGEYVLADTILAAHLTLENPFASHARVGLAFTQQQNLFGGAVWDCLLRVSSNLLPAYAGQIVCSSPRRHPTSSLSVSGC